MPIKHPQPTVAQQTSTRHERRFHPDNTLPRGKEAVFVFGSNLAGRHGAGAAKTAHVNFRAEYGVGRGPTGMAYALPTKGKKLDVLPLEVVAQHVANFLDHARQNPKTEFFVTRVGCGLAGYRDEQIAPLFKKAPLNCSLPEPWRELVS